MTYLKKCEGGTICWQNNASNRNLLLFTSITASITWIIKQSKYYSLEIVWCRKCMMHLCVWNMYIFVNIFLRAKCQKKIHLSKLLYSSHQLLISIKDIQILYCNFLHLCSQENVQWWNLGSISSELRFLDYKFRSQKKSSGFSKTWSW